MRGSLFLLKKSKKRTKTAPKCLGMGRDMRINIFDYAEKTEEGVVLCEHMKALDLNSRKWKHIEKISDDIWDEIISIIFPEIER